MNYILSFCKITGKSRIFKRHFYLPLLKPQTPKDALRTFKITGKWLLGSKVQHYMPVLFNHRRKRPKTSKDYGKITHKLMKGYKYLTPVLDPSVESHQLLANILKSKTGDGKFVYTVEDKKHNLVFSAELELAIRDGDVLDVLVSQNSNKILIKLNNYKKVPMELENFNLDEPMFNGEGETSAEEEKFHHYGKFTMSLARIFEEKERELEEWELELMNIIHRRKKQHGEGTMEWEEMVKEGIKYLDWKQFEKDAKTVIDTIFEPVEEEHIGMEVDDFNITKNVAEKITKTDGLHLLPSMNEINDIVQNLGAAKPFVLTTEDNQKLSGVKMMIKGKEYFIPGQMVKTEEGEVFVPGQSVENEFGTEYSPGMTINLDGVPTLITGLIMAEDSKQKPMFLPSDSTITADGQLTFTTNPEERPKPVPKVEISSPPEKISPKPEEEQQEEQQPKPEKKSAPPEKKLKKKKKRKPKVPEELPLETIILEEFIPEEEPPVSLEELLNEVTVDIPEEVVAIDLVEETPSYLEEASFIDDNSKKESTLDILTEDEEDIHNSIFDIDMKPMDDGMDNVIASVEDKKTSLQQKLEELRKMTVPVGDDFVTYVTLEDANDIAAKITQDEDKRYKLSDVMLTLTRRASTFRERSKINIKNINNPIMLDSSVFITEADERFFESNPTVKIALKSAAFAANDIFKKRPRDQALALNTVGDMLADFLKDKDKLLEELCLLMNTPIDRNEICSSIFKELTQDIKENKVDVLRKVVELSDKQDHAGMIDKIVDVLPEADIMTEAVKKLGKATPEVVYLIADGVQDGLNKIKTESGAVYHLENCIVEAVKIFSEEKLHEFAVLSDVDTIKDFVLEGVALSKALGLQEVSERLNQLLIDPDVNILSADKASLELLKRLVIIRKLAEKDYSCKTALERIRKNPDCAQTDPRIRKLVRESASMMLQPNPIKTSKEIPLRLFRTENFLAIEDYLIRRNKGEQPILISRNGVQAVVPKEAARGVLAGRVPYILIDESGVTNFKPMHMFNALKLSKNRGKRYENYASVGGHERLLDLEPKKRHEEVYSPPKRSSAERYADKYTYSREPLPMTPTSRGSTRPQAYQYA